MQQHCALLSGVQAARGVLLPAGGLPGAWGQSGAFQQLALLTAAGNGLAGTLPASWAASGSFPQLQYLSLKGNRQAPGCRPCPLMRPACAGQDLRR